MMTKKQWERLEAMGADGQQTWDLSPKDEAMIKAALVSLKHDRRMARDRSKEVAELRTMLPEAHPVPESDEVDWRWMAHQEKKRANAAEAERDTLRKRFGEAEATLRGIATECTICGRMPPAEVTKTVRLIPGAECLYAACDLGGVLTMGTTPHAERARDCLAGIETEVGS